VVVVVVVVERFVGGVRREEGLGDGVCFLGTRVRRVTK
jgi:hypothetical protein